MNRVRIEVSGGFLLLAAFLLYVDEHGILLWATLACLIHELGHCGAIWLLGGRIKGLRLTIAGAELCLSPGMSLSYGGELAAALAGPGANLSVAFFCAWLGSRGEVESCFLFSGLNLAIGAFNLLPISPLDGGRAIRLLISALWSQSLAEQVSDTLTLAGVVFLLLTGGGLLVKGGGNPTLILTSLWLAEGALSTGRRRAEERRRARPARRHSYR